VLRVATSPNVKTVKKQQLYKALADDVKKTVEKQQL